RFYQIQSRRGSQKATIALAHQLLKIAYILLKEQITYPEFLVQKKRSTKIRHGNSYLKKCLCQAAFAVKKQKGSPLADRFYQIQSRRGSQKATIALAHQLLKIAYILLKEQITYPEFLVQKKTTRDELVA
ncbi:hypothetical protein MKL14_07370, partial [Streptococcus suis]|nr:hypothetical protein [Streptococcus suis]MCH1648821.1 hypothetical protein [Streptococcus suis]